MVLDFYCCSCFTGRVAGVLVSAAIVRMELLQMVGTDCFTEMIDIST